MRFHPVLLLIALLVACAHPPTPSPTAVSQALATPTTTPTPSQTPTLPPTHTATRPGTPSATVTPFPSHTPTAPLTPTPPMAPAGTIYFFWDPNLPFLAGQEPRFVLYQASPGISVAEWSIQAISEPLYGIPEVALSPDQTKLAFTVIQDKNGDGSASIKGFNLGFDGKNIYLYDFSNGVIQQITNDYSRIYSLSWADNQTITYQNLTEIFSVNIFSHQRYKLIPSLPDNVTVVWWSPDGTNLAIRLESDQLNLFNKETGRLVTVGGLQSGYRLQWSFNSQWLASTLLVGGGGLALVEYESLEITTLVELPDGILFAWHPNQQLLAFTKKIGQFSGVTSDTQLFLWDAETYTDILLYEVQTISQPIWDTNGQVIWIGIQQEADGGILFIDLDNKIPVWLWHSDNLQTIRPLAWSPDGQWLLFFCERENKAGLYVIHRTGGEPYLVWETTNTYMPQPLFWLPDTQLVNDHN